MMAHVIPELRRTIAMVAASAVVAAASLVATSPASAYTYSNTLRPGSAVTYRTTGSFNMGYGSISSGPITAYRSPASGGLQRVTIRWKLWRTYGGSTWTLVSDSWRTWDLDPGEHAPEPGWTYESPYLGHFATELTITWRTPTGTLLGQSFRDYNQAADYQCLVWNGCSVVWIGGQYTLKLN